MASFLQAEACPSCYRSLPAVPNARFCEWCGAALGKPAEFPAIELQQISKGFGGQRVLNELSLTVETGECVAIIGMSGSGKSVLLENIIGFMQPDSGTIRLFGQPVSATSDGERSELQSQIGMVFQGAALIDGLNVLHNVTLPLTAKGVARSEAESKAAPLLKSVGIPEGSFDRYPSELSGGMQKRVAIARALIANSRILLYDEPTSGLDAATSTTISRLMREVQLSNPQMASIVITHDYLSAGLIADRVLFLDRRQGRLVEVLGRQEIALIREKHAESPEQAIAIIRLRLERFFRQVPEHSPESRREVRRASLLGLVSWQMVNVLKLLGTTVLMFRRIKVPLGDLRIGSKLLEIGGRSLPVTAAAGLFFGMMLSLQIALGLQGSGLLDPLPRIAGSALVDKVGPLVIGLLMAGRIAASVSADIGGKRLSRQFDAFRAMSISPEAHWLTPTFWASVIVLPLLAMVLDGTALIGAYVMAVLRYHVKGSLFVKTVLADVSFWQFQFSLLRTALFGGVVALVGYVNGAAEKRSSEDVGEATTVAVVSASMSIIALDSLLTFALSF